jgi:hypothetical protein
MDKFWQWMEEQTLEREREFNICCTEGCGALNIAYNKEYFPKTMLIGYMLEYIRDHEHWNKSKDQPFPHYEMEFRMAVWGRDHYECFKEIIEKIDKEHGNDAMLYGQCSHCKYDDYNRYKEPCVECENFKDGYKEYDNFEWKNNH